MPKAKVTVRQLKNIESGIDVTITDCKEEAGLLSVKLEYQILVVSNLSCFKTSEHTPDDVVQFVIRRKHEDFVELHRVLSIKYPSVILPGVSATGMAIFQDVKVREQKESLERFLKRIVNDKELAHCYLSLQFLGVNPVVAGNFQRNKHPVGEVSVKKGIFEEDRDDENLFADSTAAGDTGDTLSEQDELFTTSAVKTNSGGDSTVATRLFDEQDFGGEKEDVSELLLPEVSNQPVTGTDRQIMEEEDDLLNITDDLDDLLKQTKKKGAAKASSTKPKLPPKPGGTTGKPQLPPKPGQSVTKTEKPSPDDPDLGADDILKYIQEATDQQEEEVDLFS